MESSEREKQVIQLRDPKFYLESFCKIKGKTPGLIPFILTNAQKDFLNAARRSNRIMALKCRQLGFCLSPDTMVLLADMTWKVIDDLRPGDEIVGIEEDVLGGAGSSRKMIRSSVEAKWDVFEDAYEITFDDGTTVTSTADHRWFAQKKPIAASIRYRDPKWKKLKELAVGDRICKITNVHDKPSYEDGWIGKKLPANGNTWRTIVGIKAVGKQRMIDLQTSSKTFIANGYVSHNSTLIAGYLYHKTITNPGTTTALVAHKADVAAEFLDKVKLFWRSTPEVLRPQIHYNSKYEISFPALDSKIMVMSGDNVGRGFTIHNAHLSEMAMWEKPEEMMNAIENAVPANGQIIIESTPMGVGNLYHRMWASKDNGYEKKEYGWWWHYTEEEIEMIRKRIGDPLRFAQEYELEFLASGRQVFNPHLIRRLQAGILKSGAITKLETGVEFTVFQRDDELRVYKPAEPEHLYVVGVDVAEGVAGGDYSTAIVFDRRTGEEVAFYRGHIAADKFGALLNTWGRLYNDALMVVEINNHGLTTVTALKNLLYPTMYFRPAQFDRIGTKWSDRLGWKTTKVTRPLMIDDLNDALREDSIHLHSEEIMEEMITFIFDGGNNMVAMSGFHDDGIFASAIGFQGFKVMYSGTLDQINYESELPSSTSY